LGLELHDCVQTPVSLMYILYKVVGFRRSGHIFVCIVLAQFLTMHARYKFKTSVLYSFGRVDAYMQLYSVIDFQFLSPSFLIP